MLIRKYKNNIKKTNENFEELPKNLEAQFEFYKKLFLAIEDGQFTKRYDNCFKQVREGLMLYRASSLEQGVEEYKKAVNIYYKPFIDKYSYILENYLVNYIFRELIPYKKEKPLENYMDLVLHYSIIKIHLIGVSAYNKGLDIDRCIDTIQIVCKKYEHSATYFDIVLDYMKKRYYKFDFALITMLLRD